MARLSNQVSWYTVVGVVPATVSLSGAGAGAGIGASVSSCGLTMTDRTVEQRLILVV
jgi:hypothetical protein